MRGKNGLDNDLSVIQTYVDLWPVVLQKNNIQENSW